MIGILVITLLTCVAVAYVVAPFRRPESGGAATESDAIEEAQERKTAALNAIIDLEEEAQVGKLTQKELETLRTEYERDALAALERLDTLTTSLADDPLEAEIQAMRKRLACPSCGAMREQGTTCSRCGA